MVGQKLALTYRAIYIVRSKLPSCIGAGRFCMLELRLIWWNTNTIVKLRHTTPYVLPDVDGGAAVHSRSVNQGLLVNA